MALPAEQRFDIAMGAAEIARLVHIGADAGKTFEVLLDVSGSFLAGDAELVGETKRRDAVDNAEIDRFRPPPHFTRHTLDRNAEHFRRRHGVNVEPVAEGLLQNGLDIHAMTASEMFGVPIKGMPGEVRRRAKAINFGIIYGISAFGLANQLGIAREEASAYIKKYFERFPGIRAYMDETRDFCRTHGYVKTLFGRKCHYPDIKASNASVRSFNERAAINARLQGTAADIIRRAMIRMEDAFAKHKLNAQMLLQVHD